MYCTLYVLYILHTVHIVHVPCFHVSDVEVSSSTSVHHTCSHFIKYSHTSVHLVLLTKHIALSLVLRALHHRGSVTCVGIVQDSSSGVFDLFLSWEVRIDSVDRSCVQISIELIIGYLLPNLLGEIALILFGLFD